jgi:hypothetical protein
MKNYLVKTLFKVHDTNWRVVDRSHEENLYDNYLEMHRISLASCKKFLHGDWELKFLGGDVDHINQAFEKTFWFIHDLWHNEPCNILYTDPDTLCVRPVTFWGEYDTFRMFNYTDPKEYLLSNRYNKWFDHYFNAGVRYFPNTMSKDIWKMGTDMASNWNYDDYNTEQTILNAMLWEQGVTKDQVIEPAKAWQLFHSDIEFAQRWNKLPINEACILHLHGSRDSKSRVQTMRSFADQHLTEF